jgi:diguanylate cyclase (GGDEF)-like protein
MVDPLTGIANRRSFLQDAADLSKRPVTSCGPSAVMLIDLDHFKSINDRFGHAIGDQVLKIFARTAKGLLRPTDLIGRLGGEEFAAILTNVNRDKALLIAEQIRVDFAEATLDVDGYPVGSTLSIGIVLHQAGPLDVPELLAQADQALYCAKECGRNRVELMTSDLLRKREETALPQLALSKSAA